MPQRFAEATAKLMQRLPVWFAMAKDPRSLGAQFLNITGLAIEDIEEALDYALKNRFIDTASTALIDTVYKAHLPSRFDLNHTLEVYADKAPLEQSRSVYAFVNPEATSVNPLNLHNAYYVDYNLRVLYTRRLYDGKVRAVIKNQDKQTLLDVQLRLEPHHVWNVFDEFGLLLATPRIYGESNANYKERLLGVFKYPGGTHHQGLLNSLSRELGLRKRLSWPDRGIDLVLSDAHIDATTVEVDGKVFPAVCDNDSVVLRGNPELSGLSSIVTYSAGLSLHELHNQSDTAFQNELYTLDKHASPVLQYYVETITSRIPIMWGQFTWGESFWDTTDTGAGGLGVIPAFYDAKITGWSNYRR